jgi:hypothetical protein
VLDDVRESVSSRHGDGICSMCVARELELTRGHAHALTGRLTSEDQFARESGHCSECDKLKLVTRLT